MGSGYMLRMHAQCACSVRCACSVACSVCMLSVPSAPRPQHPSSLTTATQACSPLITHNLHARGLLRTRVWVQWPRTLAAAPCCSTAATCCRIRTGGASCMCALRPISGATRAWATGYRRALGCRLSDAGRVYVTRAHPAGQAWHDILTCGAALSESAAVIWLDRANWTGSL